MLEHLLRLRRAGQLRFRAETFGLYLPAIPDVRPWWQVSGSSLLMLLMSIRRYAAWRKDLSRVAECGPHEWWGSRWPGIDVEGELSRLVDWEETTAAGD